MNNFITHWVRWLFDCFGVIFFPLCHKDKQLSSFWFSNPQSSRSRWRCCSLLRNMAGSRRQPAPVTWGRTMPLLTASRQLSLIPAGGRPPRKQPSPASQVASRHLFLQCSSTNSAEIRSRPSPETTREFSVELNEHVNLYIENLLYLQAASYLGVFCMCVFLCPCRILCPQSDTGNAFWPGLARRGFPQRGGPLLQPGVLHLLGGMMMSHGCSLWFLLHSFPCFFLYVCNYFFGPF